MQEPYKNRTVLCPKGLNGSVLADFLDKEVISSQFPSQTPKISLNFIEEIALM